MDDELFPNKPVFHPDGKLRLKLPGVKTEELLASKYVDSLYVYIPTLCFTSDKACDIHCLIVFPLGLVAGRDGTGRLRNVEQLTF